MMKKMLTAVCLIWMVTLTAHSQTENKAAEKQNVLEMMRQVSYADADALFMDMDGNPSMFAGQEEMVQTMFDSPEFKDMLVAELTKDWDTPPTEEDKEAMVKFTRLMMTIMTKVEKMGVLNVDSCSEETKALFDKMVKEIDLSAYTREGVGEAGAYVKKENGYITEVLTIQNTDSMHTVTLFRGKLKEEDLKLFDEETIKALFERNKDNFSKMKDEHSAFPFPF